MLSPVTCFWVWRFLWGVTTIYYISCKILPQTNYYLCTMYSTISVPLSTCMFLPLVQWCNKYMQYTWLYMYMYMHVEVDFKEPPMYRNPLISLYIHVAIYIPGSFNITVMVSWLWICPMPEFVSLDRDRHVIRVLLICGVTLSTRVSSSHLSCGGDT